MTSAPTGGTCQTSKTAAELFNSPFAEPFDPDTYWEENPQATDALLNAAEAEHNRRMQPVVTGLREVCAACPMLQQCRDWVMSLEADQPVAGVVAGMTEYERWHLRGASPVRIRKTLSTTHVLDDTLSQELVQIAESMSPTPSPSSEKFL